MTNEAANGSGSPNASRNDVIRRGAFAACLLLYVVSLCVPTVHYNNHYGLVYGWWVAVFGWSPAFTFQLLWIAHPLMWVGIICFLYRRFRVATWLSSLAILLALPFRFNYPSANSQFLGGQYLWVGSMVVLLVLTLTAPPSDAGGRGSDPAG